MTCPGLTQVASGEPGGLAAACHSPTPPPCQLSGRRNFLLPSLSPMSSLTPAPSITPGASLPLGVVPTPSPVPAGGDSQVRRCRLVRLAPAKDGVSAALAHVSACFGSPLGFSEGCRLAASSEEPPLSPVLGAGWERSLVSPARCCHRARCSAPRRAGGEGGGTGGTGRGGRR